MQEIHRSYKGKDKSPSLEAALYVIHCYCELISLYASANSFLEHPQKQK